MLNRLIALVAFTLSIFAEAYHVSKLGGAIVDFDRPTRVLVVGYSGGMGDLFLKAASSRARRYQQSFPEDQILVVRNKENANDVGGWDTYLGFEVYETGSTRLSGQRLIHFLTKFRNSTLKSLDVYSHSAPPAGMALERGNSLDYFSINTPDVALLRNIFSESGYANIHGCNGGYYQAPNLSKVWGVPVSGALASTDFQRLNSDGSWYFNNQGQFPTGSTWASRNMLSFTSPLPWMRGGIRMKPQNTPYNGVWGSLSHGLPFGKFFCSYEGATEEDCAQRMGESLMGFVTTKNLTADTSFEDYKVAVQDYLCPVNTNSPAIREDCVEALVASETDATVTYASLRHGQEADCDMASCKLTLQCTGSRCKVTDEAGNPLPPTKNPRTIIDEYRRYLMGYGALAESL